MVDPTGDNTTALGALAAGGAARRRGPLARWLLRLTPPSEGWAMWQRACGGDAEAAGTLVRQLAPPALALAMQLLHQRADAEDVVQESFLRLWRSRPSDQHGAAIGTYFNTIVVNRCRSLLVRRRELATEPDALTALADQQQQLTGPAEGAAARAAPVRAALLGLPPRQRMALAMWAYADATVPEIAAALEIDRNAAHQLLHRARQALRLRLAALESTP
jgi:RNA polymerase sigma-70 factor (ECF subfamily)